MVGTPGASLEQPDSQGREMPVNMANYFSADQSSHSKNKYSSRENLKNFVKGDRHTSQNTMNLFELASQNRKPMKDDLRLRVAQDPKKS
jgi:hypothetical protein